MAELDVTARMEEESARRRMVSMLEAVLIFHSGGPWSPIKAHTYAQLTDGADASTKGMCDAIRLRLESLGYASMPQCLREGE